MESVSNTKKQHDLNQLPFVAPCRELDTFAPLRWLKLGWQDIKRAPKQSLSYGFVVFIISALVSILAYELGNAILLFSLLSGFVFIGPVVAIGLYSVSCQLQSGISPRLGYCLREGRRHFGNAMIFSFVLIIVFLVWARAASMVHIFFPVEANPEFNDFVIFLGVGSAIGSVFAAIVFSISAFSLPMIMDRKVDVITAVVTSVNTVLRNKKAMLMWATLIVTLITTGFITGFLGLIVLMPLIGHATWHAYQEAIDASAWPEHE